MTEPPPDLSKLQYILYVSPGDSNCIRACRLVPKKSRIFIQNVHLLPTPWPRFLDGVPLLIRLKDDKMFRGSSALEELQRYWQFLELHFSLESDGGRAFKVGFIDPNNSNNSRDTYSFPLTLQNLNQTGPPTQTGPSQNGQTGKPSQTVQSPPTMLPLPPPNIRVDGSQLLDSGNGSLGNPGPLQQPPPPKQKGVRLLPLPPPQDPTGPSALDFNPLKIDLNNPSRTQGAPPEPVPSLNSLPPAYPTVNGYSQPAYSSSPPAQTENGS